MKKRMNFGKKVLAWLMVLLMMGQVLPVSAEENGSAEQTANAQEETQIAEQDAEQEQQEELKDEQDEEQNVEAEENLVQASEKSEGQEQEAQAVYTLQYQAHCQSVGWQDWRNGGEQAGTTGKGKRMEALAIKVSETKTDPSDPEKQLTEELAGAIEYRAHCQTYGWQDWKKDGEIAGTTGKGKRLEAIQIRLTGELAEKYDIYYQVHCSRFGDMGWAKNGEIAGTTGYARAIEAINIILVEKNSENAPEQTKRSYISPTAKGTLTYEAHVQTYGWMDSVADGQSAGTSGLGKRMEAFRMYLENPVGEDGTEIEGSIKYRAHSQSYGWLPWQEEGGIAGTVGKGKRLEALEITLEGELANVYDVYYRVHSSKWGTLGWAKNGETAGTIGFYRSVEFVEVKLVKKNSGEAPEQNARACLDKEDIGALSYSVYLKDMGWQTETGNTQVAGITGQSKTIEALKMQIATGEAGNTADLFTGGINYKAYMQSTGWQELVSDGETAGSEASGKRMEAVQLTLTGELAQYCDIYYRAHVQAYGWLGWAKNGQTAGTSNCAYRMEALQVYIVPKSAPAPGANSNYFKNTKKSSIKKIAEFSTHCTSANTSLFNMSRALQSFNGLVVQPGQTISFFGVAGPCGRAQGYVAGGVVGGVGYGGGICQASTTLYGATLRAGLTIVERRNHSVASTYVPLGQDAMVNYGTSDFKFRNDYNFPVTLKTWTSGRDIHVAIYGQEPGWFDSVKINSWRTGPKSAAAERIFYKNGVEVKRERLTNSYYR